jgi:hypothetical protein
MLLLAIDQHSRRTAALLPNSAPNRHNCNRQALAALRAAVQQQVTPSCASQLLQRLAPAWWATRTASGLPQHYQRNTVDQIKHICEAGMSNVLDGVKRMCDLYVPTKEPFHALGEWGDAESREICVWWCADGSTHAAGQPYSVCVFACKHLRVHAPLVLPRACTTGCASRGTGSNL